MKAAILEAGSSLGPSEIRERVERLGFAEQLSKNPNYLYTVIFRLTSRGELVREGDRYRLPTGDNPPEEAAGVNVPRLFTFERSAEAVQPARVGGT